MRKVSRLSDKWRTATNSKRAENGGGFGGIASLEKKRQFRAMDPKEDDKRKQSSGQDMVFDRDSIRPRRDPSSDSMRFRRKRSRSRSPRRRDDFRRRSPRRDDRGRTDRADTYYRDKRW